jgi:hypothetical protein
LFLIVLHLATLITSEDTPTCKSDASAASVLLGLGFEDEYGSGETLRTFAASIAEGMHVHVTNVHDDQLLLGSRISVASVSGKYLRPYNLCLGLGKNVATRHICNQEVQLIHMLAYLSLSLAL